MLLHFFNVKPSAFFYINNTLSRAALIENHSETHPGLEEPPAVVPELGGVAAVRGCAHRRRPDVCQAASHGQVLPLGPVPHSQVHCWLQWGEGRDLQHRDQANGCERAPPPPYIILLNYVQFLFSAEDVQELFFCWKQTCM